jgi:dolichyl-phosphate beta-glucosyltransferase
MKTAIISSTSLFLGFGFVYTSHLDYKYRFKKDCYKPNYYSMNGHFSYPILPIFSNESQDNIFLSLVFPAYNEEERLGKTLDETINYFSSLKICYEIIIINGGSTDKTFQLITQKISEYSLKYENLIDIICASYTDNGGKGWAVKTGIDICRGKYILMLDSDGSTNIEEFESLYNSIKDESYAIAIGSRRISNNENIEENVERAWYRKLLSNINNFIVKKCIGIDDIEDTQCGFKLFTRKAAIDIFKNLHIVKWAFDVDMLYICNKLGIKIKEIPVRWKEMPGSKLNIISASLLFIRDYLAMILFYKTGFWKINNYSFREINII